MSARSSRNHWRSRPGGDSYAKDAAKRGLGSRAWFKLQALDSKYKLIRSGAKVLELGAAPGGWTRYLASRKARVFACDLQKMEVPRRVEFFCGEVEGEAFHNWCEAHGPYNLVISDMAPDMSGIRASDMARAQTLVALACEVAKDRLELGGTLVVKLFQGEPADYFRDWARTAFTCVRLSKPPASRPESSEIYGIAQSFTSISQQTR